MDTTELIKYILEIDSLTTSEFCEKYKVPKPIFTGEVESSANEFLQIDAIKHRLFVERAKQLYSNRITLDFLKKVIMSSEITGYSFFEKLDYDPPLIGYKFEGFEIDLRIFAGAINFGVQTDTWGTETSIPICEGCNSYLAKCVQYIFKKIVEEYRYSSCE